jgi:hypothetical protein
MLNITEDAMSVCRSAVRQLRTGPRNPRRLRLVGSEAGFTSVR